MRNITHHTVCPHQVAAMHAKQTALVLIAFHVIVRRVPERLAGHRLVHATAHVRVAVAAPALRVPVVQKRHTAAQTTVERCK